MLNSSTSILYIIAEAFSAAKVRFFCNKNTQSDIKMPLSQRIILHYPIREYKVLAHVYDTTTLLYDFYQKVYPLNYVF